MTSKIAGIKDGPITGQDQRTEDVGDDGNRWCINGNAFAELPEVFKEWLHS